MKTALIDSDGDDIGANNDNDNDNDYHESKQNFESVIIGLICVHNKSNTPKSSDKARLNKSNRVFDEFQNTNPNTTSDPNSNLPTHSTIVLCMNIAKCLEKKNKVLKRNLSGEFESNICLILSLN